MRIVILTSMILLINSFMFANTEDSMGIIYETDFRQIGVSEENIVKAKKAVATATRNHELIGLEKKQVELEIKQHLLNGAEENWDIICSLFDEIGALEAETMKNKLKSQLEVRSYITTQQYIDARTEALKRMNEEEALEN